MRQTIITAAKYAASIVLATAAGAALFATGQARAEREADYQYGSRLAACQQAIHHADKAIEAYYRWGADATDEDGVTKEASQARREHGNAVYGLYLDVAKGCREQGK